MRYRRLGTSGLKVSELCLGTMTFGSSFHNIAVVDQAGATKMVERALAAGVNFFDTANMYSYGESEQILGSALEEVGVERKDFVVATKVRGAMSEEAMEGTGDVNNVGLSRKHIFESCRASLDRLGLDSIDLLQVHGWDPNSPIEETLEALNDLVRNEYVRYIGCSNWSARHLMKGLRICEEKGWARFISLQAYYSLANRDLEHELLPLCTEEGLGVMPWSPLAGGFLTGKYGRGTSAPEDARRVDFDFPPIKEDAAYDAVEAMREISERTGAGIPQIALNWLTERQGVDSVIIGAKDMEQLEENLGAVDIELSDEDHERLDDVTQPPALYPEWMYMMQEERDLPDNVG